MSTVANVLERWGMVIDPPTDVWFSDWALRSPKQVGIHLTAGWHAYNSLLRVYTPDDVSSVTEYFGGMGVQSLVAQELFAPVGHVVMDYSPDAVRHMKRVLPSFVDVRQADSYDPTSVVPADLVGLDFGDLTAWKTREGEPHRKLLDRVFELEPKAVVLTDVAGPYLHLHRDRYEGLLGPGTCVSYETYLDALVGRLQELYGYVLVAGYSHRWSTVMAMVPRGDAKPGSFQPTPASPIGLDLL